MFQGQPQFTRNLHPVLSIPLQKLKENGKNPVKHDFSLNE